ncbi:Uncharacterised protein [Mycobacteroides abscessus subsp. abscessus]|nr:Uncharacterised protein [Mycobacteroides abscessus subsp. abscessus]
MDNSFRAGSSVIATSSRLSLPISDAIPASVNTSVSYSMCSPSSSPGNASTVSG